MLSVHCTPKDIFDMKPIALMIAAISFLAASTVTIAIIRAISMGDPEMSFAIGAILGSQVGAIMHHRQPGAKPTLAAKAVLCFVLAVCAVTLGVIFHLTMKPFDFVEVSVPIAAIGSFVFPFVLFNTMWKSLSKKETASNPTDA